MKSFAFCPRKFFFDYHLGERITLEQRIKMLVGKLWHLIIERFIKGEKEKETKGRFGNVVVIGRADVVTEEAIVEIKKNRGPRDGAWFSDVMQAVLYAIIEEKEKVIIRYLNKEVEIKLEEKLVNQAVMLIDLMNLVKKGYLPPPFRSRWCSKCPWREICETLGDEWDHWFAKTPRVYRP